MRRVRSFLLASLTAATALAVAAPSALGMVAVTSSFTTGASPIEVGGTLTATAVPDTPNGTVVCTWTVDTDTPVVGTETFTVPTGVADIGTHTLSVECDDDDASPQSATPDLEYEVVDTTPPPAPTLAAPDTGDRLGDSSPDLDWNAVGAGGGSAIATYTLTIVGGPGRVIAVTAPTTVATVAPALPDGTYSWSVTATDAEGNTSAASASRTFSIDTTAPAAPTISGGPTGLTRDTTPSFAWSGEAGAVFSWQVRNAAGTVLASATDVTSTAATVAGLPADGAYAFSVTQSDVPRDDGSGRLTGPAATRAFTLDTTAPAVPTLTVLPTSPSTNPNPVFGWSPGESGARFGWRIVNSSAENLASGSTTGTTASPVGIVAGTHKFQVWQIDAAGNASARAEALFTVRNPPPADVDPFGKFAKPQTRLAQRLRPAAGARITTASARVRWYKPTARTVLYNFQLFRMAPNSTLTKIHSVFPRGTSYTVPARLLKPNTRYVYQVWAYEGPQRGYLSNPIGISYFDKLKTIRPPNLIAPRGNHRAGRRLIVRWRAAPRTRYYRVRLYRGSRLIVSRRTRARRLGIHARYLPPRAENYRVIISRGIGAPTRNRYVKKAWAGRKFRVVKPATSS